MQPGRPNPALPSRRRVIRNIGANWIGLFTMLVVGFFLTPFILHRLGQVAFGLWVLMTTVTGYYGLLDFGIRNAVLRYAARFAVNNEEIDAATVVSTAFFTYSLVGAIILLISLLAAWKLDSLLRVPAEWLQTARLLLLVVGAGTALSFPLSVFGGVLEGLQQFTWVAGVQMIGTLVRAGLIVVALESGYGLLAVGVITVVVSVVTSLAYVVIAFAVCPQMRLRWRYVRPGTLRLLGSFGLVTFWIGIAMKLRFEADALVIGAFLSVQAIALFAVSSRLVGYATEVVQSLAMVFTPLFSYFDATGDRRRLQHVLVLGNRCSSFIAFPLAAALLITGKSVIRAWVGAEYVASYPILVTLTIPMTLYLAQAASTKVLYGMARHTTLAWVLLAEGIANVGLSILLLHWYGILGVALGTAVPLAATSLVFLPVHVCRTVGVPLRAYLRDAHLYPFVLSVAFGVILWATSRWLAAVTYAGILLELAIAGGVCAVGVLVFRHLTARSVKLRSLHDDELIQPAAPV